MPSPRTPRATEIAVRAVDKRFGKTAALSQVSFTVAAGEVVGLVGENGAGKTTLLRIMAGFLDPDAGRVEVAGHDVSRERAAARACIGYMAETFPLYRDMRVADYLAFRARLKGLDRGAARPRVAAVCERLGLAGAERRVISRLSKGYHQRVALADALLCDPPILLLDEPTSGLDPVQVRELRGLLLELAARHTVIVSSHVLTEIEATAGRVIVLAGGRVAGDGALDELRAACGLGGESTLEDVFVALTGPRAERAGGPGIGPGGEAP